jgi:hypothetical protein
LRFIAHHGNSYPAFCRQCDLEVSLSINHNASVTVNLLNRSSRQWRSLFSVNYPPFYFHCFLGRKSNQALVLKQPCLAPTAASLV